MRAGRRGALGVANAREDSRPRGGGMEAGAAGLVAFGWVSMAYGSDEGSWRMAG